MSTTLALLHHNAAKSGLPNAPSLPKSSPSASLSSTRRASRVASSEESEDYGPRSAPLFYTGLLETPQRLLWEAMPGVRSYRVTIGLFRPEGKFVSLVSGTTAEGVRAWPLDGLPLRPGLLYAWYVEPASAPFPVSEAADTLRQEGRFWLLDAEGAERWERSQALFEDVADPDIQEIGLALIMAEVGLYYDALRTIQTGPAQRADLARQTLVYTAQAVVYRQLGQQLAQELQSPSYGEPPPTCFAEWAAARERRYRQKALVRMRTPTPEEPFRHTPVRPKQTHTDKESLQPVRRAA